MIIRKIDRHFSHTQIGVQVCSKNQKYKNIVWSNENISQNRLLVFVWKTYFNNSNLTSNRYVHKKLGDKNNNVNNTLLICLGFYTKANQT